VSTFPTIIPPDPLPLVDPNFVRPTVDEVALLENSRTVTAGGGLAGTFTDQTRPTADQVETIIDTSTEAILSQLPQEMAAIFFPRVKHAITLYASILIETSFYREQTDTGAASVYQRMLDNAVSSLVTDMGGSDGEATRTVDSVRAIGETAFFDPFRRLYETWPYFGV
jgi:hypothetical protein